MSTPLVINDKVTLPGHDLEWTAVRASGPGGQNVNKVSSKIELSFDFEDSVALSDPTKARLRQLAKNTLDAEGRILVTSQKTRDQSKNLADARDKLRDIILKALVVPK
ncbi:alternative ribosome rescue aminoacyl-tRNA hydrolase ArfB, partial [Escherichia coli]|uniref:alternative ribosome rescue aminoacyl-tRNA hydrolase ArfB n=1 Tax=Escherichia coli TaxID=562 RepID=UPI00159B8BE1